MKKFFLFCLLAVIIILTPWMLISFSAANKIYTNIEDIPTRKYWLLLGTSPWNNWNNPFFYTRIEATKELFEKKKIEYIIVSGDNSTAAYNEPQYMKTELERKWIPSDRIIMDYAGFRTLDSVLRARDVFSLTDDITIISQPFHLERAIFLARFHKINAIWYGAADVNLAYWFPTYIREIWARWLAIYDAVKWTEAKFWWEKINIQTN